MPVHQCRDMMVQRREFIKKVAAGSAAAAVSPRLWGVTPSSGHSDHWGKVLPKRPFGNTGEEVTLYCMGGSHVAKADSENESRAIIEKGMEMGVRFYENAWTYAGGRAEELYGKYLIPKYRDQIFLATKNKGYDRENAIKQLEDSFRRLKCDVIDLYYMHEVRTPGDVDDRLAAGVLEVLLKAQQDGKVRHLGFSGHMHTAAHRRLMERVAGKDPFVAVQFPVSPIDAAKPDSFVRELIPDLRKRDYALMGMKGMAHGRFFRDNRDGWENPDPIIPNYLSVEEVICYNLSQPVTAIVSGTDRLEQVEQNVNAAWKFARLSREEQERIVMKLDGFRKTVGLEYYRPDPTI